MFLSNAESEIGFNSTEFSESKIITWKFHVLTEKQRLTYYVIMGHGLMKELQIDVLYPEDIVVWDSVRLYIQKIKNGKWTDLNLMDK